MKRPPRPGEKIFVRTELNEKWIGGWTGWTDYPVFEAQIWCHAGLWLGLAWRVVEIGDLVRPRWYGTRQARVHRFDEGVTWVRDDGGVSSLAFRAQIRLGG